MLNYQVSHSKVACSVQLGKARLKVQDFLHLQKGDIVKLDQQTARDLQFLVGDIPKYLGRPALQGRKVVFSVTDPIQE